MNSSTSNNNKVYVRFAGIHIQLECNLTDKVETVKQRFINEINNTQNNQLVRIELLCGNIAMEDNKILRSYQSNFRWENNKRYLDVRYEEIQNATQPTAPHYSDAQHPSGAPPPYPGPTPTTPPPTYDEATGNQPTQHRDCNSQQPGGNLSQRQPQPNQPRNPQSPNTRIKQQSNKNYKKFYGTGILSGILLTVLVIVSSCIDKYVEKSDRKLLIQAVLGILVLILGVSTCLCLFLGCTSEKNQVDVNQANNIDIISV